MNENELTKGIVKMLRAAGVWCYRTHRPLFPPPPENADVSDICGIYLGKPLYIEVKGPRTKIKPGQVTFIENAKEQGAIGFFADSYEVVVEQLGLNVII